VKITLFHFYIGLFIRLLLICPLSAQTGLDNIGDQRDNSRLLLALSTVDYPATPGDVYNLSYSTRIAGSGETVVSMPLTLDASYQLKILNLGTINARNKTYLQIKRETENLISQNYPLSGAVFTLVRIGAFSVLVTGEITASGNQNVDGLTRVSTLLRDLTAKVSSRRIISESAAEEYQNGVDSTGGGADSLTRIPALTADLTDKASTRFIQITQSNGAARTCDLFQFQRFGDLSQDPYIRPGDKIQIPPAKRKVSITGEVFRPGTYELLPGEELVNLVEYYGDGFTLDADPGRVRLSRISTKTAGETRIFDYQENTGMTLEDRDLITVGNKMVTRPIVFFEGALSNISGAGVIEETNVEIDGMAKLEYPFYEGETLGNAVRENAVRFTAASDLANAYIIRGGKHISMDLNRYIYYNDFNHDIKLENGDIILIPFQQYFVLVSGAVKTPGRYPYVPDRQPEYYINLAGGRDETQNNGRGETITDINNRKVKDGTMIEPEMMIKVPANRVLVQFNQYAPVIMTALSIMTTLLSILAITRSF
jgi:protein involved in polysaccharide export with SLBB domain